MVIGSEELRFCKNNKKNGKTKRKCPGGMKKFRRGCFRGGSGYASGVSDIVADSRCFLCFLVATPAAFLDEEHAYRSDGD